MDRRIKKTRNEIKRALLEASTIKGIEHVTVQDIVDRADINRATFYYHYKDKKDLVERIESETLEGLIQNIHIKNVPFHSFADIVYPPILASLEHVKNFEEVYKILLSNNGISNFRWKMLETIKTSVRESFEPFQKKNIEIINDKSYLVNFIAGAHLSVIIDWVNTGLEIEPKLLAKHMASMLTDGVTIKFR
ncbi:TetR/AcrR family transcriptional regulator C-terminal domain-containing protein [Bacillus sp. RO1]|uniref:TetR/AcrR family transcriptional regulator n=1 Tax=Bacillus sp. RO1 TaxID=2722703 RepID=UPI001456692A|nr:TetR/AcrR family transcriptional regulator C-terminal domain-containing protein [Bacillus sp. RO1]NLP50409.1 TetR/AcrR family transcriptional regulator [Bacillus sp. RO1]